MGGPSRFCLILACGTLAACAEQPAPRAASPAPVMAQSLQNNGPQPGHGRIEHAPSDSLPSHAFRGMIEAVAKEIASAPAYQDAANAPTIALGDFHNATPLKMDRTMALESLRAQTILASGGKVRFRDDAAYGAIVDERARQSAVSAAVERSGWRPAASSHFEQKVAVDARVAEARVLLSGSVFQLHDRDPQRADWGTTLHQFHFRLVEVRTGLILWEKVVGITTEGAIVATKDAPPPGESRRSRPGFTTRMAR